jgi:hypothetical protein
MSAGGDEFDGAFKQAAAVNRRRRPQNLEEEANNMTGPPIKAALKGGWSNAKAQGGSPGSGGDEPAAARRRADGCAPCRDAAPAPRRAREISQRSSASPARADRVSRAPAPADCPARLRADRTRAHSIGGQPPASDDDDDGIPLIPDLEEVTAEANAGPAPTVANAPSARANARVQTLAELDAAIANSSLPSVPVETGIDLSLLQRVLHPYDEVAEPDEEWRFDTLVTQIAHELSVDEAAAAARAERLAELQKASAKKPLSAATVRVGTRAPVNKGPDTRLSDE